nr:DinB family protein [Bacilli bacterium]
MIEASEFLTWLEQYEVGADVLEEALTGVSESLLQFRPHPDKWSIQEIVSHLVDTELVMMYRIRTVMAEGKGALASFDQDRWVDELSGSQQPVSLSVSTIRHLRVWQAYAFRQLLARDRLEVLSFTGMHTVNGEMSVYDIVQKTVSHLHHHVRQIESIKNEALKDS